MSLVIFEGLTPESNTLHYILKTGAKGDMIVMNPDTEKREAIRYASNQPSIYVREQVGPSILPSIVMEEGWLKVDADDEVLLDFLRLSPQFNVDFREVDPERDAQEALEFEEQMLSVKSAILTKSQEKYGDVSLASLLVMKSKKAFRPDQIDAMGPSQVRQILYNLAENDPEDFLDKKGKVNCFDNNDFVRNDIVIRSVHAGIITVAPTGREIFWGNGEDLLDVPVGKNYRTYLADFFLSSDGEKVMETLAQELEKMDKKKKK